MASFGFVDRYGWAMNWKPPVGNSCRSHGILMSRFGHHQKGPAVEQKQPQKQQQKKKAEMEYVI